MEPRWLPLEKEVSKSNGAAGAIARDRIIMGDPSGVGSGGENEFSLTQYE